MPVSKSLAKIQKNLKSGNKKQTIHPRGRKFQQLNRATVRENKIAAKKKAHHERRSNELARIKFLQDRINGDNLKDQKVFTHVETASFIQEFIDRDEDELQELKSKRRPDRPPSNRQLLLEQRKKVEMEEFIKGFLIPDLTDEKNVVFLRAWNDTFGAMSTLKLIRIGKDGQQLLTAKSETMDVSME